jgi:hypothetical protein
MATRVIERGTAPYPPTHTPPPHGARASRLSNPPPTLDPAGAPHDASTDHHAHRSVLTCRMCAIAGESRSSFNTRPILRNRSLPSRGTSRLYHHRCMYRGRVPCLVQLAAEERGGRSGRGWLWRAHPQPLLVAGRCVWPLCVYGGPWCKGGAAGWAGSAPVRVANSVSGLCGVPPIRAVGVLVFIRRTHPLAAPCRRRHHPLLRPPPRSAADAARQREGDEEGEEVCVRVVL